MNRLTRLLARLILPGLLCLIPPAHADAGKHILIGADPWCPLQCFDKAKPYGITLDVLKAIFEPKGYSVEMKSMPWEQAVKALRSGAITTFGPASRTDAPDLIYAFEPVAHNRNVIFKRAADPWDYKTVASLEAGRLAVVTGYTYGFSLDAYIKENAKFDQRIANVGGEDTLGTMMRMLTAGQVRYFVEDRDVTLYRAGKDGIKDVKPAFEVSDIPLLFGFSPKDPHARTLAQAAEQGLRLIKANGELKKIFARYGLSCEDCR